MHTMLLRARRRYGQAAELFVGRIRGMTRFGLRSERLPPVIVEAQVSEPGLYQCFDGELGSFHAVLQRAGRLVDLHVNDDVAEEIARRLEAGQAFEDFVRLDDSTGFLTLAPLLQILQPPAESG